jgi:molybdopterin molybdotransferase
MAPPMETPAHDDVRMRGFRERVTLEEARRRIVLSVSPLGKSETAPLREALDRVLAEDVLAPRAVPSFDRSAMDGYAVEAARTFSATAYDPVVLELAGESMPAAPFEGRLSGARTIRIMTGAPLPDGADAVVPAEFAEETRGLVRVSGPVTPGRHVSRAGEDLAEGATVLSSGRTLRPQDLGILAAVGLEQVAVAPRPRASVVATGDEIARSGTELGPWQVHDADTPMLAGLLERWGARTGTTTLQPDDLPRLRRALGRAVGNASTDLVLVTGGSSVGREDHVPGLLAEAGRLVFHGVALRPAGPVAFGVVEGKPVFALPGNPVSCLCAFDLLVGPCIRRLQGLPAIEPYRRARLPLARRLASVAGRADYARVAVTDGGLEPVSVSGASILSSAVRADGWVLVPPEVEGYEEGEAVEVRLY